MPSAMVSKTLAAKRAAKAINHVQARTPLQLHQPFKLSVAELSPRGRISSARSQDRLCSAARRCPSARAWCAISCNAGTKKPSPPREQFFIPSESTTLDVWHQMPYGASVSLTSSQDSFDPIATPSAASSAPDMQVGACLPNMSTVAALLQSFSAERAALQECAHLNLLYGPRQPPLLEHQLPFMANILAAAIALDTASNTADYFEPSPFAHLDPLQPDWTQMNSAPLHVSASWGAWGGPATRPVMPQAPPYLLPELDSTPTHQSLDLSGVRAIWEKPLCGQQNCNAWPTAQVAT